jgi:hypothetical protein
MSFLARGPRSAVGDHLCGRGPLVNMRRPAGLMALRGEAAPAPTPVGAAANPVASFTER